MYWKTHCFGLTADKLLDKVVELKYCGGSYGGNHKPTRFLCLALKMLQLQPEREIVYEFIRNEDFKYLRALGAFYLRLVGKPVEVYTHLEPLYSDYRKLAHRSVQGWASMHMDEFIDELLNAEIVCDITLPFLPKRCKLGQLPPRASELLDELEEEEANDSHNHNHNHNHSGNDNDKDNDDIDKVNDSDSDSESVKVSHNHIAQDISNYKAGDEGAYHEHGSSRRDRSRSRDRDNKGDCDNKGDRDNKGDIVNNNSSTSNDDKAMGMQIDSQQQQPLDAEAIARKAAAAERRFDRLFGGSKKDKDKEKEQMGRARQQNAAAPAEGSVEYWNMMRDKLGLGKLKE